VKLRDLNPFWRQLPVYSPVTFRSLWAGLAGAIGFGDPLERLRDLLLNEYGSYRLLVLDSGTSALRLAISGALADTGSDIVALPAYCCFDVATAAVGADAKVALYDVRPDTLGPDFDSLREALDAGARAIVVAHLYGIPVDLDRCRELATEYDAVLIEDAAQGAGGSWRDRPLGSWGDLGVLSFGRGKGRTGGGGGVLLANNDRGADIVEGSRGCPGSGGSGFNSIAKLAVQWALGRPALYGIPASLPFLGLGETKYKEPWEPRGMATGPAAALLANWEASRREEEWRKRVSDRWARAGSNTDALHVQLPFAEAQPGCLRLPVFSSSVSVDYCNADSGLGPSYPSPLSVIPAISSRSVVAGRFPGSVEIVSRLSTLPCHSLIDHTDYPT